MEERKVLLARMLKSRTGAAEWVKKFKELPDKTESLVYPLIKNYVRNKLLLSQEECIDGDLLHLADASLRRILKLKRQGIEIEDVSNGCSGASSVITKKVLLMKAVQNDFEISLTAEESAEIRTLEELTRKIVTRYS